MTNLYLFRSLTWVLLLVGALAFVGLSQPAGAQNAQDDPELARQFVLSLADDAINILDDHGLNAIERENAFLELLRRGFDVPTITKLVLGRHSRTSDRATVTKFEEVFPEYVLGLYADRLTEFGDEQVVVLNVVPAGKRDVYVRSRIVRPNGPPISADWRIHRRGDELKVIDLKIEGISLVITQREEFAAKIAADGLEALVSELEKRIGLTQVASQEISNQGGVEDNE